MDTVIHVFAGFIPKIAGGGKISIQVLNEGAIIIDYSITQQPCEEGEVICKISLQFPDTNPGNFSIEKLQEGWSLVDGSKKFPKKWEPVWHECFRAISSILTKQQIDNQSCAATGTTECWAINEKPLLDLIEAQSKRN